MVSIRTSLFQFSFAYSYCSLTTLPEIMFILWMWMWYYPLYPLWVIDDQVSWSWSGTQSHRQCQAVVPWFHTLVTRLMLVVAGTWLWQQVSLMLCCCFPHLWLSYLSWKHCSFVIVSVRQLSVLSV